MHKKIILFLVLLFGTVILGKAHKYYSSISELNFNAKTHGLEIGMSTFIDDVELCLSKRANKKITFNHPLFKSLLIEALRETFQLKNEKGKLLQFQFVNLELNKNHLNVFFEFEKLKNLNGYQIKNSFLIHQFPEQVNILNIKSPKGKASLIFNKDNREFKTIPAS